jgi:hypothetical protein
MDTLIILDWDDTLFPTSWIIKSGLDIYNKSNKQNMVEILHPLDDILHSFLNKISSFGEIQIITNALPEWVYFCSSLLPKTSKILSTINVISARDKYQKKFPNISTFWKTFAFTNAPSVKTKKHIISVGDDVSEYLALIHLNTNKRILKAIRFLGSPDYRQLLEQLYILSITFNKIYNPKKHMDLRFTRKNNQIKQDQFAQCNKKTTNFC